MTNPSPDPRSSRLGFDELLGIVVAFTVIGTILVVSLRQKDRGFSLGSLMPSLTTTTQPSPNATASPTPATPLPTATEELQGNTPLPDPRATAPDPSPSPTVSVTPQRVSRVSPLVPVPVPVAVTSPSPVASPSPTPQQAVSFSDVPQDFWARPFIAALAARGILVGFEDGTFRPNQPVTRAEFATQLAKAFEQKPVAGALNYKDVPSDFWASQTIQETTRSGFMRGYPGNLFRPTQPIPKLEALIALTSGLNLTSTSAPGQVLGAYQDAAQIPKYAVPKVAVATERGLVVNYPNPQLLKPKQNATRAEIAALVYQSLVQAGKAQAIPSKYVVKP
jgi:hypothetical protein